MLSNFRLIRREVIHRDRVDYTDALANPQALAGYAWFAAPSEQ